MDTPPLGIGQSSPITTSATTLTCSYPGLSFITVNDPSQSKLPDQRKAVRSHAAFYQHHNDRKTQQAHGTQVCESTHVSVGQRKRSRRRKHNVAVPLETGILSLAQEAQEHQSDEKQSKSSDQWLRFIAINLPFSPCSMLGEGRVDPFKTYPVPWEPFLPLLVDHYVVHVAQDMPELDEPQKPGLLRTRWFPFVLSEAATFQVIMLLAASHYASLREHSGDGPKLLLLKSKAISSINKALDVIDSSTSDQLIGAVAKMASYEAIYGDQSAFEMHMTGLLKMVQLRGGLSSLGLGGLLARICIWIDRNSAFIHNSRIHFTSVPDELSAQANPSGFLAAS